MSKSVLITGCSSGIGHAAAHYLKQQGFNVVASARRPQDVLQLEQEGLQAVLLDLADDSSIEQGLEQALAYTNGTLYGLFNNGAYGQPGALEDLPTEALREQFNTNLFGTHHLTRLVLPLMLQAGEGRIIQNSSVLGLVAMKYRGAYNASKFALEGYTDTLRLELAGTPVHVSLLEPGPIETQFRANARAAFLRHINMKDSRHRAGYEQTLARLEKPGPSSRYSLPAQACLPPVLHALTSASPKARYPVTRPTKMLGWLRRFMSTAALDRLMLKAGG